jgi:hypothetical protein
LSPILAPNLAARTTLRITRTALIATIKEVIMVETLTRVAIMVETLTTKVEIPTTKVEILTIKVETQTKVVTIIIMVEAPTTREEVLTRHQETPALSAVEPILMITELEFVSVLLDSSKDRTDVNLENLVEPIRSVLLVDSAVAQLDIKTILEFVQDVLLVPSGAQLLPNVFMSVARTLHLTPELMPANVYKDLGLWEVFARAAPETTLSATDIVLLVPSTPNSMKNQETVTASLDFSLMSLVSAARNAVPMKSTTPRHLSVSAERDLVELLVDAQFVLLELRLQLMAPVAPTAKPMKCFREEDVSARLDMLPTQPQFAQSATNSPTDSSSMASVQFVPRALLLLEETAVDVLLERSSKDQCVLVNAKLTKFLTKMVTASPAEPTKSSLVVCVFARPATP